MKDLDVTQVFCEVLTGLGFLLVVLGLFGLLGPYAVQEIVFYVGTKLTIASLGAILVAAYLIGTIVDAIGLALDKLFLFGLVFKEEPSEIDREKFWKSVSAHVLAYREAQWTYYSCYRNLFILFVPGSILWTMVVWKRTGIVWGIVAVVMFFLLETALFVTMKMLVEIYYKITKSV